MSIKGNMNSLKKTYSTDSGMYCVWDPKTFVNINDYNSWEKELLKDADIEKHVRNGHIVPINIGSGGVFVIDLRISLGNDMVELSPRERKYLTASSQPYLFLSTGTICISGIEFIESKPGRHVGRVNLPSGDYSVSIHLIAWDEEPGTRDNKGQPKLEALSDFVVLVNPKKGNEHFRTKIITFDLPSRKTNA